MPLWQCNPSAYPTRTCKRALSFPQLARAQASSWMDVSITLFMIWDMFHVLVYSCNRRSLVTVSRPEQRPVVVTSKPNASRKEQLCRDNGWTDISLHSLKSLATKTEYLSRVWNSWPMKETKFLGKAVLVKQVFFSKHRCFMCFF